MCSGHVTATQNGKGLAVSEMCVAVKLIPIFISKIIRLFINLKDYCFLDINVFIGFNFVHKWL